MQLLDLTLPQVAANIALDEALLEEAEQCDAASDTLRLWEVPSPAVVIGRSSRVASETNQAECTQRDIPIIRRATGGAAIVAGPGCLMYSVVLSTRGRPALRIIDHAHTFVLDNVLSAVQSLVPNARRQGISDLTLKGRKFSGNSLRSKRHHLLYHGTLLYDFPLDLIHQCLGAPPRQPEYRNLRSHADFVCNIPASAEDLRASLQEVWQARDLRTDYPAERVKRLLETRYERDTWNRRLP